MQPEVVRADVGNWQVVADEEEFVRRQEVIREQLGRRFRVERLL